MIDIDEKQLAEYREVIESELVQALHGNDKITEAMRYSTLGGGKRIRGVLVLEFCRVFGGNVNKASCVAAAVEMIQAFSLIHDDLPCMDNDDERRGKPSCHKQFGEASALLAGDALLAGAFNSACFSALMPNGLKPENAMKIVSTLSNATVEMIRGQQIDMDFETQKKISDEDIINMYSRKTCALISAACVCGAICANARDKDIHMARSFGVALGLAFQIADDLLDFKEDKQSGKKTYATLFGEKKAKEKAREYTDTAIKIMDKLPNNEFLKELAVGLNNRRD
jgi:geranylgeranyl diphosphate synthase type II